MQGMDMLILEHFGCDVERKPLMAIFTKLNIFQI